MSPSSSICSRNVIKSLHSTEIQLVFPKARMSRFLQPDLHKERCCTTFFSNPLASMPFLITSFYFYSDLAFFSHQLKIFLPSLKFFPQIVLPSQSGDLSICPSYHNLYFLKNYCSVISCTCLFEFQTLFQFYVVCRLQILTCIL